MQATSITQHFINASHMHTHMHMHMHMHMSSCVDADMKVQMTVIHDAPIKFSLDK